MQIDVLGCNGPFPAAGEACSGYLLTNEGRKVLLDCGAGVMGKLLLRCNPCEPDAVVLSHLHADHCSDMGVLRYYCEANGKKLPVYLPMEDATGARNFFACGAFEFHDIKTADRIAGMQVKTLRVRHPAVCYAVRYQTDAGDFVYTGDTNTCDALDGFCENADILLADAMFAESEWAENKPHLSAALAGKLAKQANVKRLYLTHFSPLRDNLLLQTQAREYFASAENVRPDFVIKG